MANRVYITYYSGVTLQEAIEAVNVCLKGKVGVGEVAELTNGVYLCYNDKTKNPSFQVWRQKK